MFEKGREESGGKKRAQTSGRAAKWLPVKDQKSDLNLKSYSGRISLLGGKTRKSYFRELVFNLERRIWRRMGIHILLFLLPFIFFILFNLKKTF